MQGSKSLSKRKREVDAEEQGEREARQLRREMRMRGHVVRCPPPACLACHAMLNKTGHSSSSVREL